MLQGMSWILLASLDFASENIRLLCFSVTVFFSALHYLYLPAFHLHLPFLHFKVILPHRHNL